MRGAVATLIMTALLMAGCGAVEDSAPRDQAAATPPHLWPVEVSSGQRFVNEAFGVSAVFPAGAAVCVAESGTHHHGYYGRVGYRGPLCSPSADTPEAVVLGVYGDYNAAEHRTPRDVRTGDCLSEFPDEAMLAPDGQPFALRNMPSVPCILEEEEDRVTILVTGLAGRRRGDESGVPTVTYSAWLTTSRGRLHGDKLLFQQFLDGLVLTPPAPQGG